MEIIPIRPVKGQDKIVLLLDTNLEDLRVSVQTTEKDQNPFQISGAYAALDLVFNERDLRVVVAFLKRNKNLGKFFDVLLRQTEYGTDIFASLSVVTSDIAFLEADLDPGVYFSLCKRIDDQETELMVSAAGSVSNEEFAPFWELAKKNQFYVLSPSEPDLLRQGKTKPGWLIRYPLHTEVTQ